MKLAILVSVDSQPETYNMLVASTLGLDGMCLIAYMFVGAKKNTLGSIAFSWAHGPVPCPSGNCFRKFRKDLEF